MSENYIVINGKRAELTPEQLKALGLENPFERKINYKYWKIAGDGKIYVTTDYDKRDDNDLYDVANYCTNMEIMQQRAYAETLNRLLWRYSMEHDGDKINWHNNYYTKYCIIYSYCDNKYFAAEVSSYHGIGTPWFYSAKTAKAAIKEIIEPFLAEHPDFKYTEAM